MKFEFNKQSVFLMVFLTHLAVYSVLSFKRYLDKRNTSDFLLALLLLLGCLYACPWMLGFAGWYDNQPYRDVLFYVPFQQLFFIGPVGLLYVLYLLNPGFKIKPTFFYHFAPGVLYLLYAVVCFVTDKLIYHNYVLVDGIQDPEFDAWYQYLGLASIAAYFFIAYRYYTNYKRMVLNFLSNADMFSFTWIRNFFVAVLIFIICWLSINFYSAITGGSYIASWWYFLVFSLLFYYIAITGYSNNTVSRLYIKNWTLHRTPDIVVLTEGRQKMLNRYIPKQGEEENHEIEQEQTITEPPKDSNPPDTELLEKIALIIIRHQLYTNPGLSLTNLSVATKTGLHTLSRLINTQSGQNFNDYINSFRVNSVIQKMKAGEHHKTTLIGLAYDCGFNSKTTFQRSFKKHTGTTPSAYIKTHNL